MAADDRVALRGVTVRYGRRVALEAVSGEFAAGQPDRRGRRQRRRQEHAAGGIAGTVRLAGGSVDIAPRAAAPGLPAAARGHRTPTIPLTVQELITLGGWREFGAFRAPMPALRARVATRPRRPSGLTGRLASPDRRTIGGRVAARAVRPPDPAGRRGDPARRAVRRGRCRDHVGAARSGYRDGIRRDAP